MKGRDVELVQVDIDISNVANEFYDDDQIGIYAPKTRNDAGQITSTALKVVPLTAGKASVKLKPGPVVLRFMCQGVADAREHAGWVPDTGPVSLADVIPQWTPALVDQGIMAILAAMDEALGQVGGAVAAEIGNTTHVIGISTNVHANKVVRLDAQGKLAIGAGTVTAGTDPANKSYVDVEVGKKAERTHTHAAADIVTGTTEYVNFTDDDRFANRLVRLNSSGKLTILTAGITGPNDPVNKQYVDNAILDSSGQTSWWN